MNSKMKTKLILVLSALFCVSGAGAMGNQPQQQDPEVVSQVDLNRYLGTWNEIAHSPNFFQNSCVRSVAEYASLSASSISVHNICYRDDGTTTDIRGVAQLPDPKVTAKLKVRFNFFARGDYWVIALDPNYQWAVVSAPKKKSLFILARQAPMEATLLAKIVQDLKAQGFATEKFIYDQY